MNLFVKVHKRKLILASIIFLVFVGFKVMQSRENTADLTGVDEGSPRNQRVGKQASVISFGAWFPTEFRTVLGQVVSESDIEVKAELNGTMAQVIPSVGDKVEAGQVLARFKTSGDPATINYQSALSNLQTIRLSSQNNVRSAEIAVENARKSLEQTIIQQNTNSVRSAEIALENARKSLAQTKIQQEQNYDQAYELLRLESQSIKTLITSAIDTIDKHVQFSHKYQYNQAIAYTQIGNTDVVGLQNMKNQGQQLALKEQALIDVSPKANEIQIMQDANNRLSLLKSLQQTFDNLEILIERTAINSRISEGQVNGFLAVVEGVHSTIDTRVGTYQTAIDRAHSAREQTRLSILGAQNAVDSALANLELTKAQAQSQVLAAQNAIDSALVNVELAKSQADAQIVGAQNQVNISAASTADLVVRAPISGTIANKMVSAGDLVSPGVGLFTIVNEAQEKKVVAYLSQDERLQAQQATTIEIEIEGKRVPVTEKFFSPQIDIQTQKLLAEFTIPPSTTLVGNFATVRIPIGSTFDGVSNLIPFSAVSFESDGAEVLVLEANNLAERRKIIVGRVVVSNIEVIGGLQSGDRVIEYYKRVFPGDKVLEDTVPSPEGQNTSLDEALPNTENLNSNLANHNE